MQNYFNEKDKYYINSQKYSECQLISAINAAIFLNELPVLQDSIEYERLVDLVNARHGAAINIKYAHKYLRIICYELETITLNSVKKYLNVKRPIEAGIHTPSFHSALIIDHYKKDGNYVRVLNMREMTDSKGWIEWKRFKKHCRKVKPGGWVLTLNPWYLRDLQIKNNQRILGEK
jgi:hypothetical protein